MEVVGTFVHIVSPIVFDDDSIYKLVLGMNFAASLFYSIPPEQNFTLFLDSRNRTIKK